MGGYLLGDALGQFYSKNGFSMPEVRFILGPAVVFGNVLLFNYFDLPYFVPIMISLGFANQTGLMPL